MAEAEFLILPEKPGDHHLIEHLLDTVFGLERRVKTAYRLREGSAPLTDLCLTAWRNGKLAGSIKFWPLIVGGETEAILLGPLAVDPVLHGQGCGLALMKHGLEKAAALGHRLVILVGDEPYYARVGFRRIPDGRLQLPGPVDPNRFLARELVPGSLDEARGLVLGNRAQGDNCRSAALAVPGDADQGQ